jgi:integrase/recombinase XerD
MTRQTSRSRSPAESTARSPLLREFLLYLAAERGLADNSIKAYRRDLEGLETFFESRNTTIENADVDHYLSYLREQTRDGQSTRTVTRRVAAIRVFLKYRSGQGESTGAILQQVQRPKLDQPLPKILSRSQVNQLIAGPDPDSPLFWRDVAAIELLYAAGLRASELCDLKLNDLNLTVGCVRVMGKGMKERIVPVGEPAVHALTNYLRECRPAFDRCRSDCVFISRTGRPLERVALWMLVERCGRKSGLLKHIHPHILRHCFASHLLSGGADLRVVQELLGHSNVVTTQVYTHVDQARLRAIHQKFHPRK